VDNALAVHRLHFAFTATYHYLFPQLTMGLAPLIVLLKVLALRKNDATYAEAARFLAKLFGIAFVFGVVTGIPMEFQFGTGWARFSRYAGGVIGQTLAMEGMFAFFLESAFLGLFLYGESRLSPRAHLLAAFAVFAGSWLSGYFIIATDAWMQHPVGYVLDEKGQAALTSLSALLLNPWAFWQYLHNMGGALVTGAFSVAALGAYYRLSGKGGEVAKVLLQVGVLVAAGASAAQIFPTGDRQGYMVAHHQPATLAAMEGLFATESAGAPLVIIGQPNTVERRLDNPLSVPKMLSFLTYKRWDAEVKGLDDFPANEHPDNIALLYYSYHVMVGLGTIFVAVTGLAVLLWWRKRLQDNRLMQWALMLAFPLPFIANTAGWMTAELGRQPWLVYGLLRTSAGVSPRVSAGNGLFTLLGFMGLYTVLSMVFLLLMAREISHGPGVAVGSGAAGTSPGASSREEH